MHPILQQFFQRKASTPVQFVKYAICGGIAVGVNTIAFYLLSWLVLPALGPEDPVVRLAGLTVQPMSDAERTLRAALDNGMAFMVSNLAAYLLNITWVFEPGRHRKVVEIGMFYAVSGSSCAIGITLQSLLIYYGAFSTTVAFIAQLVVAALINFAARKYFIFKG